MKKMFVILAAGAVLAVLVKRLGPKMPNVDWEKKIESLPDNAPPKWMFRNITAIRKNTDRILEVLGSGRAAQDQAAPPPPGDDADAEAELAGRKGPSSQQSAAALLRHVGVLRGGRRPCPAVPRAVRREFTCGDAVLARRLWRVVAISHSTAIAAITTVRPAPLALTSI